MMRQLNRWGSAALAVFVAALALAAIPVTGSAAPAYGALHAARLLAVGATTTTAALDGAMKVIFSDPLVTNVVTDSELMSLFKTDGNVKVEETTGGRYIELSHLFQLPAGVGARSEGDYIPVPDDPVFKNSRVYLKKVQGTVEMTGDVMRRVTSNEGAFIDYMQQSLPGLSERLVNEVDRMYAGYGIGAKARVNTVTGTGTLTIALKNALGVSGYTAPWLQFLEGERVVFTANAAANPVVLRGAGSNQSGVVTSINEDTNTITVTVTAGTLGSAGSDPVAANDWIGAGDPAGHSFPNSGVNREISGLLAGVDDGNIVDTYNNIQRSAAGNRLWKSVVIDASVSPFFGAMTEDILTYADEETRVRGNGKVDLIVMSLSAARGYWKSLKSDRFFIDPRGQFQGGKKEGGLTVVLNDRTLPLKVARKLPPQVTFGLTTSAFTRLTLGTWDWDDKTGSMWNRVTDSTGRKDAFYATGFMYEELFNKAPRKSFRIDNLNAVT